MRPKVEISLDMIAGNEEEDHFLLEAESIGRKMQWAKSSLPSPTLNSLRVKRRLMEKQLYN